MATTPTAIWLVKHPDEDVGYDEYDGFVVRAVDAVEARQIAADAGMEGAGKHCEHAACDRIDEEGEVGVILGSFNAG